VRVLLTGGAGFIGGHVLRELLRRGHDVRVFDSLREDVHHGTTPVLPAELVVGDVRDADSVDRSLRDIDVVAHLAAKVGLGVDVQDLPDYADSNDHGTAVLLAAMARAGITRLTLAASMVAYGEGLGDCAQHGPIAPAPRVESALRAGRFESPCPLCAAPLAPLLVDETAPLSPRNGYAASKVAQEFLASAWARATGSGAVALRYHNVYGLGMPRNTPYAGVAAVFLSALRRGEAPQVFEDGGQRRDFVNVRDVATATADAIEHEPVGMEVFNVGSGTPRTVGEMAAELSRAVAGPEPVVTGAYRLGDVRHITADSSRLRSTFGWVPALQFSDGLRELATEEDRDVDVTKP
jgi:dTDP-L-rhamnose 4-epimerase